MLDTFQEVVDLHLEYVHVHVLEAILEEKKCFR